MSGRTRERNQARLVRCSTGCGALVWLAGALPTTADDHFTCASCTAARLRAEAHLVEEHAEEYHEQWAKVAAACPAKDVGGNPCVRPDHTDKFHIFAGTPAAADYLRLAAAPPTVVESIVGDRGLYLADAAGAVYLAEEVDPRHVPAAGQLYRLTPADILPDLAASIQAALTATARYLATHKESGPAQLPDRPGEASGGASAVDAPRAARLLDGIERPF